MRRALGFSCHHQQLYLDSSSLNRVFAASSLSLFTVQSHLPSCRLRYFCLFPRFSAAMLGLAACVAARIARRASATGPLSYTPSTVPPPRAAGGAVTHWWLATSASSSAATTDAHLCPAAAAGITGGASAPWVGGRPPGAPRPWGGSLAAPAAGARWASAAAGGGGEAGVPSATEITAALNTVNERFGEARLLLGEARDALGSVYFGASFGQVGAGAGRACAACWPLRVRRGGCWGASAPAGACALVFPWLSTLCAVSKWFSQTAAA